MKFYYMTNTGPVQRHRKQFRAGGAIMIIRTHLYGEKSHSYGVTIKTGGAPAPGAALLPMSIQLQILAVYM